jgi:uncharacterized protein
LSKLDRLKNILKEMERVLVAFSGGVDSSFLLRVGKEVLGDNILAVTACSATYPQAELETAKQIAQLLDVRHIIIDSEELDIPEFQDNPPNRCYYCKKELFGKLKELAFQEGIGFVVDGSNVDDLGDHRPGMVAAQEMGIRSPLREAGLTKREIRAYSKDLGLSTWEKPPFACLSSRFPYGEKITREKLYRVDQAEEYLRNKGFRQIRVRHHDTIARIEVYKSDLGKFLEIGLAEEVVTKLKELGFKYVTLDLEGYRSGSMNEVLTLTEREE